MKKAAIILFVILLLIGGIFLQGKEQSEKELISQLPERYQKWLDLVTYIITKDERTTFLMLDNDRDRDVFVSLFWNLRDRTPATEKNEFLEEHSRRFQYANKYYKYGTARPGWQTDMGRIYIILGEPESIDRYEMDSTVLPCQIWSYYGKKRPGLPNSFWIVFWKKNEVGEYRLYDPTSDGPYSLLRKRKASFETDPTNNEEIYEMIREEHPVLARASLSLVPDELPYNFNPTLRSQQLLTRVMIFPQEQINDTYATGFLKYKGHVEVDYSINYIESRHQVMVFKNPETGLDFVNFAVRPREISAQSAAKGDSYSFSFTMTVSLKKGERSIFEYRKNFPFSGSKEELLSKFANSLVFSDLFPAAVGDYTLSVLLQNLVNKEFTYFDADISVKPANPALPVISGLMTTKAINRINRLALLPFKFRDMEVVPLPRKVFGKSDRVFVVFAVDPGNYKRELKAVIEVQNLADERYKKSHSVPIERSQQVQFLNRELEAMAPGYYQFSLRLEGPGGAKLAEQSDEFTVSISEHVPDTSNIYRISSLENVCHHHHILGLQYMRLGQLERAEAFLRKALLKRPGWPPFIKDYAGLLLRLKKPGRILEVVENLKSDEKHRFDYHALRGKALFLQQAYKEAIEALRKANTIYDSDTSVLNTLGLSYLKTGNKQEAQKVLSASLKLNGQQKSVAQLLKDLE